MRRVLPAIIVASMGLALLGCRSKPTGPFHDPIEGRAKDYDQPLPAGQLALVKITDPNQIPDFTPACQDLTGLREAIARSLNYLAKPSSQRYYPYGDITHDHVVAGLEAFDALIASNLPPTAMNREIRRQFDVYTSVGCDGKGTVLFTGYYTPILDASPAPTERFRHPLYRPPANLVKDAEGNTLGLQQPDGTLARVSDRAGLEASGMLAGLELVWLGDRFEAYVAQVQGSARLRMPDGSLRTVGYAASNGHDYQSVREALVRDGKLPEQDSGLQRMMQYFRSWPQDLEAYLARNPRYVFFTETEGPARGSINEPVTPWRTIATDKTIFPRACLAMVRTRVPAPAGGTVQALPYSGFLLDQDTGGGIRAAGRADIYMGEGDAAVDLAGRTREEGRLYYLFLKLTGGPVR